MHARRANIACIQAKQQCMLAFAFQSKQCIGKAGLYSLFFCVGKWGLESQEKKFRDYTFDLYRPLSGKRRNPAAFRAVRGIRALAPICPLSCKHNAVREARTSQYKLSANPGVALLSPSLLTREFHTHGARAVFSRQVLLCLGGSRLQEGQRRTGKTGREHPGIARSRPAAQFASTGAAIQSARCEEDAFPEAGLSYARVRGRSDGGEGAADVVMGLQ